MKSEIETITYSNGDRQRVQIVTLDNWEQIDFLTPEYSEESFLKICNLYRYFIVPKCPWIFGQMILFRLPAGYPSDHLTYRSKEYGTVSDSVSAAAITLKKGLTLIGGKPFFRSSSARKLWDDLKSAGCIQIIRGFLPFTTVLPVGNSFGFLSMCEEGAQLKANSSFFIMDRFDCGSIYDVIGTPFGLTVYRGTAISPPLFGREALLVREGGRVSVEVPSLSDLEVEINGYLLKAGETACVYSRPEFRKTGRTEGTDLVIIGSRVAAVHPGGRTVVPSSGFVLRIPDSERALGVKPGDSVFYPGFKNVLFGVQAGNSVVRNGKKSDSFLSPFYNIRKPWTNSYPPSLYPLGYKTDRAPRMVLGESRDGKPMLIWAEGAAKFGYHPGDFSCGATLSEMADICSRFGMKNGINLDGGGSAQILIRNRRFMKVSDRNREDFSETERAVPTGLIVR